MTRTAWQILRYTGSGDWAILCLGLAVSAASGVIDPVLTVLISRTFQSVSDLSTQSITSHQFISHVSSYATGIFSVGVIAIVLQWVAATSWSYLGAKKTVQIRGLLLSSLINKDMEWFDTKRSLPSLLSAAHKQIEDIDRGISSALRLLLESIITVIVLLTLVFIRSWRLTTVALAGIPVIMILVPALGSIILRRSARHRLEMGKAAGILKWTLDSLETVKIFCGENKQEGKFRNALRHTYTRAVGLYMVVGLQASLGKTIMLLGFSMGTYYAYILVNQGSISPGSAVFVIYGSLSISQRLAGLSQLLMTFQRAHSAVRSISKFIEKTENPRASLMRSIGQCPPDVKGAVCFQNVTFSYPGDNRRALNKITMNVPPGKMSMVVGPSGCGKSSLGLVLAHLYDVDAGSITIDGIALRHLSPKWLRENVHIVEQDALLFGCLSLLENVSLGSIGRASLSKDELKAACDTFYTTSFVNELPAGWYARVGSLSGGQKQRVALSRAMISAAPIMVYDESTSALDAHLRKLCMDALRKIRTGKTTIFITHDYSLIKDDDYVFYMREGTVVDHGFHDQLRKALQSSYLAFGNSSARERGSGSDKPIEEKDQCSQNSDHHVRYPELSEVRCSADSREDSRNAVDYGMLSLIKALIGLLRKKMLIFVGITINVLIGVTPPLMAFMLSKLLSSIVSVGSSNALTATMVILGVCIADGLLTYSRTIVDALCEKWINGLRERAFHNLVSQDLAFFEQAGTETDDELRRNVRLKSKRKFELLTSSAKLAQLVVNDTDSIRLVVCQFVGALISATVIGTTCFVWSIVVCWKLALASFSLVIGFCAASAFIRRYTRAWTTVRHRTLDSILGVLSEILDGIKTVKLLNKEEFFCNTLERKEDLLLETATKQAIFLGLSSGVTKGFTVFAQGLLLLYGMSLVSSGEFPATSVILVFTLILYCLQTCNQVLAAMPSVGSAFTALNEMQHLMKLESRSCKMPPLKSPRFGAVEFSKVTFGYSSSTPPLFRELSFSTGHRQVLSIVGASGCGKSTIWKLLLGLYPASHGSISIDGVDVSAISLGELRKPIAVVQQMPLSFFEGSIFENMTFGVTDTEESEESLRLRVRRAASACGMDEVIAQLPDKYDSPITSTGARGKLSGGQLQRLGIVRALLSNPKILVLDEVTSALDPVSMDAVRQFICNCRAKRDITIILITHDHDFAALADNIVSLQ